MPSSGDSFSNPEFANSFLIFLLPVALILFLAAGFMFLCFVKEHLRKILKIPEEMDVELNDSPLPTIDGDQDLWEFNPRIFSSSVMSRVIFNEPLALMPANLPSYEEATGLPTYVQAIKSMRNSLQSQSSPDSLMGAGITSQHNPDYPMGVGMTSQRSPDSSMAAGMTSQRSPDYPMEAGMTLRIFQRIPDCPMEIRINSQPSPDCPMEMEMVVQNIESDE